MSMPTQVLAKIYQWVDKNGVTHFSDTPQRNAKQLKLPRAQTYSPNIEDKQTTNSAKPNKQKKAKNEQTTLSAITITQPMDKATIRSNAGIFKVKIALTPEKAIKKTDNVVLLLDNRPVTIIPKNDLTVTLNNVDRGTHQLVAQVIDSNKKVVVESDPVTIFLHQASLKINSNPPPLNPNP
jgi:hypothetical protein